MRPAALLAAAATAANCPASDLQPPAGFATDNAAELAQLVVKILAEYADSDSQRSVQRLVDAAVAQDAFLKALAGGVVKNEKAKLKPHVGAASTSCCLHRRRRHILQPPQEAPSHCRRIGQG
jgi:hypothetical protein